MSAIYFIRHGQAGTREDYDVLSDIGHQQARLLGRYFASQNVELKAIFSGGMRRQRHTAEIACASLAEAGLPVPDIQTDQRWNEFSLTDVYKAIAHLIMKESREFARDFEQMQEALRLDPHTMKGATGRCDAAVVKAWMQDRYPGACGDGACGETWSAFRARIQARIQDLASDEEEGAVAVFTSATPIAILTAEALALSDEKIMSLLGVVYNTGLTTVKARRGDLRLLTFNALPHLPGSLATFR